MKKMIMVCCAMMIASNLLALTQTIDGITWTYTVTNGYASIGGGTSSSTAIAKTKSGAINIPSVLNGYVVTYIGAYAFSGCNKLTSVVIPDCVTDIGNQAFSGCNGLLDMVMPDSIMSIGTYVFSGCNALTNIVMSSNVMSIEDGAFYGCSSLDNITIPNSTTNIGQYAFSGCSGLTSMTMSSNVCVIRKEAFRGCSGLRYVTLSTGLESIETKGFYGCSGLTRLVIPNGVTNIGEGAFAGCSGLCEISIPFVGARRGDLTGKGALFGYIFGHYINSGGTEVWQQYAEGANFSSRTSYPCYIPSMLRSVVITDETRIGYGAFLGCADLTSIRIPGSVISIVSSAFSGVSSLKDISLPQCMCTSHLSTNLPDAYQAITNVVIDNDVTNIGNSVFDGCMALQSVDISDSVDRIGDYAFAGCDKLSKVMIGASMSSVGREAFGDCRELMAFDVSPENPFLKANEGLVLTKDGKEVVIVPYGLGTVVVPEGVERIGDYAFYNYKGLTNVAFCAGIERIGDYSFYECSAIENVSLPDSVSEIGGYAFYNCTGMKSLSLSDGLERIGSYAFCGCAEIESIELFGQAGEIGAYAFCNCNNLMHVIIPNSVTNIGNCSFNGCGKLRDVSVPQAACSTRLSSVFPAAYQSLNNVVVEEGVTNIVSRMFAGCTNLVEVTLPPSLKGIGKDAFDGCTNFSRLNIFDLNVWAQVSLGSAIGHPYDLYLNGVKVQELAIPSPVSFISKWAFAGCVSVEEIVIPESVQVIGKDAFSGCTNLSRVTLPSSLTCFGNLDLRDIEVDGSYMSNGFRIFDGWVLGYDDDTVSRIDVPEGIIGIAPYAFADFWDLEEIVLPASLKYIGCCAFMNDTYLDNVVIPDGVEYIDGEAFRGCTYLRDIEIGAGVEVIGEMAFANCTQLTSLTVPEGVETIGSCAFSNCWRMLSVKLPLSLGSIGENMFASCSSLVGVSVPTSRFTMNQLFGARSGSITSAVIVDGESVMCTNAFANCTSMETVDIPNGVTNIQTEAFRNCTQLRDVSLPETLEVIGEQAFYGCSMLSAIVMPDSVREVGNGVFRGCAALNSVTLSRNLAEVPDYAFYGCNNLVSIVVPTSIARLGAYISNKLTALYFLGNAPAYDANAYSALPSNAKTYVVQGSRGWDGIPSSRDLPSSWIGRSITTWVPNRFYATFDANDGLFPDESATYACEEITDTSYAIPPFEPHRRGYAFAGWWTDRTAGAQIKATTCVNETRDITFYAHWAIVNKPVSVRFYANGGTVEPEEATYYAGLTYETLPVPTKEHYRFTGWYTMADGGTQVLVSSEVPVAGAELFAHWSPETYVIRYNPNGGNGSMADQSFVYGATVTLRANSFWRQNSSFIGWGVSPDGPVVYADQKEISTIGAIQGGVINLYAQWTATRYAIRYDSNGGVGSMTNDTLITGVSAMLSSNLFTRAGYVFIGWATSASGEVLFGDGESVIDLATSANATVSLFAVWARDSSNVAVTFNGDKLWHPARFARNGEVVWQSGDIGDSETSDLIAMVNGSGTVSFDWCCSCEESFRGMRLDYLAFFIDDEEKDYINGSNSWATMSYTINGAGTHVLRWQYTKDSAGAAYEDCARVMSIVWEPSLSTLEEFANATNLAFSTSTNAPWFGQTVVSHDGIAALQSGGISDGETTCLECEVIGPGELSFWWKVSCEEPFRGIPLDYASFEVDGVQQEWIAGETDWTNVIVAIEGLGRHRISWSYQKDEWEGSISGYDCAWVDEIVWTPSVATDPIPAVAVDADVATVNATVDGVGFADAAVKAAIGGSAEEYNAFKTWANGVKGAVGDALAGEAAVVANGHAAAAYLLGAERLFENEPTVEIGELSIGEGESAGTTAMTVAVTVKDGESVVAVNAAKVAAMFEATGDLGDWAGAAKLSPTVTTSGTDASGKMIFVVTPGDGTASRAFLRIKR